MKIAENTIILKFIQQISLSFGVLLFPYSSHTLPILFPYSSPFDIMIFSVSYGNHFFTNVDFD